MYKNNRTWQEQIVPLDEARMARTFINMKAAVRVILHDNLPSRYQQLYTRLQGAVRADWRYAIQDIASEIIKELKIQNLTLEAAKSDLEAMQLDLDNAAKKEREYVENLRAHGGPQVREQEWYMHQLNGASRANQNCADQLYRLLRRLEHL